MFYIGCTLGSEAGAGGDGEGEVWSADLLAGLVPLWLLLFWSSGRSGEGGGRMGWIEGVTLLLGSTACVVSLDASMVTEGGDERQELWV